MDTVIEGGFVTRQMRISIKVEGFKPDLQGTLLQEVELQFEWFASGHT